MELIFQYIPLMTVTMLLYFTRFTFYFVNGCLWWIPYFKIWLYVLNRGGRSFCEIICNPNPHDTHDQNTRIIVSEMSGWNIYISTKNGLYEHRDSIVSRKRYCNFISHFWILSSFFDRHFWCILTFTIWVLSNIFLSIIVGYKLGFVRG